MRLGASTGIATTHAVVALLTLCMLHSLAIRPQQESHPSSYPADGAPSPRDIKLAQFTLAQLLDPQDLDMELLSDAVFNVGMFTVTDFMPIGPAAALPFAGSLQALVRCSQSGLLKGQTLEAELDDKQTVRSTIATATNASLVQPLPRAIIKQCPDFASSATALRRAVDSTGAAYAKALDRLLELPAGAKTGLSSFQTAVRQSESLEHFHLFHRLPGRGGSESVSADDSTAATAAGRPVLQMHSDIGLFIVMTAAEYFGSSGERLGGKAGADAGGGVDSLSSGLVIQLPDGEVVAPVIPAGCLIVMNGEGSSLWMMGSDAWGLKPQVPGHEVTAKAMAPGVVRSWFGRMYLPPRDAVLQSDEEGVPPMTFNEYREQTFAAFHDGQRHLASTAAARAQRRQYPAVTSDPAAGCSPSRRLLQDSGSCGADQILCWMTCMDIGNLSCPLSSVVCESPTGQIWVNNGSDHCFTCKPTCPSTPPVPPASPPPAPPAPCSPPPAPPSPTAAPNAGLNPPIYNWYDLVNTDPVVGPGPINGTLGTSVVVLSSMPVAGSALGQVVIAPCSTFFIHSHPRANEHSIVIEGELTVGYMFENFTFTNYTVKAGEFMVFPEGIFHFQSNRGCSTASFVLSFPVPNPGTLPATFTIATLPVDLQMSLYGEVYTTATASAVGPFPEDAACVAACQALNLTGRRL